MVTIGIIVIRGGGRCWYICVYMCGVGVWVCGCGGVGVVGVVCDMGTRALVLVLISHLI